MATFLSKASVEAARAELQIKTCGQIEAETAARWAARAVAAMELHIATGEIRWAVICGDFAGEALEHAGAAGDGYADLMRAELRAAGVP